MTINQVTNFLETLAPRALQESYDNAGLITGSPTWECEGIMVCLDITEDILQEAIDKKCNLLVAHHPIIFKGLKNINGHHYVEKCIIKAIKNDLALYAIHTNLDNVLDGVNGKIAEKLQLQNCRTLIPKAGMLKTLTVFVPQHYKETLLQALFAAGAGNIGAYSECSFSNPGLGTYLPGNNAHPFMGKIGSRHTEPEERIEVIFPKWLEPAVVAALKKNHPYEEVAYYVYCLENNYAHTGTGLVGHLPNEMDETAFLNLLQTQFNIPCIKHSKFTGKKIKQIAVCGGAGSFAIKNAIHSNSDAYVTADLKYHEFFEANGQLLLADIGHYESEQFTQDLLVDILRKNFLNFAVLKTGVNSNPVHYYSKK